MKSWFLKISGAIYIILVIYLIKIYYLPIFLMYAPIVKKRLVE